MVMERESEWEVAPTKDAVRLFIEALVDPKLPYTASIMHTPSMDDQKSVAVQMHAVVLLYNYFHRKQKPELEFLDFVPFCKLALGMQPKLKPFMRTIEGIGAVEFNGSEDDLSVTERAVKSACDIAKFLDASKDVPITKGYPISTVAVLLVDPEKENCLLQYSAVTEGVWSLIEKEVDELGKDQEMLADERVRKKLRISEQQPLPCHRKFLEIGFDAVKDVSGNEASDLEVLEQHVVCSLSKENSASQFYIVKGKKSFDPKKMHALESLIESLSGPFANNFDGAWMTSDLVEYHRLLPYAGLISNWLTRKDSSKPILIDCVAQIIKSKEVPKTPPSRMHTSPLAEYSVEDLDYINNRSDTQRISRSSTKVANGDGKFSQKKADNSSGRNVANLVDESPLILDALRNIKNIDDLLKNPFLRGEKEMTKPSMRNDANGSKKSPSLKGKPLSATPFSSSEVEKKADSKKRSYHRRANISSRQNDEKVAEDDVSLKDDIANHLKWNDDQTQDKWLPKENADDAPEEDEGVRLHAQYNREVKNAIHSNDLQNALALVERNRRILDLRICEMEEMLAVYELVIDRIRDGEDVDLARRTIKHIVEGNEHLLQYEMEAQKQTTFPNVYFPGTSSIQDLQYICQMNDWRLPRYNLKPSSNGQFVSTVSAQCVEETLCAEGSEEPSPFKARESAAAQMIAKIQAHINTIRQEN